jgi:hypothetical protein
VGKAETGPDQNHLHPSKFIQNLIKESKLISIDSDQSSFTAAARTGKLLRWAAAKRLSFQYPKQKQAEKTLHSLPILK